jgi:hypothetical protein
MPEAHGACYESSEIHVFAFNPRMSYVSVEWIKADPDFWKASERPKRCARKISP